MSEDQGYTCLQDFLDSKWTSDSTGRWKLEAECRGLQDRDQGLGTRGLGSNSEPKSPRKAA